MIETSPRRFTNEDTARAIWQIGVDQVLVEALKSRGDVDRVTYRPIL